MKIKPAKRQLLLYIGLLCSLVLFMWPLKAWAAEEVIVKTEILNIRSGPAVTYQRIGQAQLAQVLNVEEEKNGWLKIRLADGEFGWVIKDYVSFKTCEIEITGNIVNVRSGPGTTYPKVSALSQGTKVSAIDSLQDWYQIKYPSGTGWVAKWLVRKSGLEEASAETEAVNPDLNAEKLEEKTVSSLSETPVKTQSKGISWTWEKTSSGISIAIRGTKPLGYTEKITAGEPKIVLEFIGDWLNPMETQKINYGSVNEVTTEKGETGTLFQVCLDEEEPYQTSLSEDGCQLTVNVLCGDKKDNKTDNTDGNTSGKTVVIDPGHGCYSTKGYDPGAVGSSGLHESDIVLDIGQRVEQKLTEHGIQVIMTRPGEANLTLEGRANMANEICADAFVSIHVNSSVSKTLHGTTTYFYAPAGSAIEGQREMRRTLAESIQSNMLKGLGRNNLGVREQNFAVLRCTTVPSVLVETAFISNSEEEKLLADESFREQAAQAISDGLLDYLEIKH